MIILRLIVLISFSFSLMSWGQKIKYQQDSIFSIEINSGVPMHFRWIKPGVFIMGTPGIEEGRDPDEGPQHEVTISKGFYLGIYEVTQGQWKAVTDSSPSVFQQGKVTLDRPVESVSWEDCNRFINVLNKKGIGHFRFPTEAEWEYACRAGSEKPFYWGNEKSPALVSSNAWGNSWSYATTHPVGQKLPNAWGLYDMSGNVWEWCSDWYGDYIENQLTDPPGPLNGSEKVFRGGSWYDFPVSLRSGNRHRHVPNRPFTSIGLRIVMEKEVQR